MSVYRLHPEARAEFLDAIDDYGARADAGDLASDFADAVIQRIRQEVRSGVERLPEYPGTDARYSHVPRFPYLLIFARGPDIVLVAAVAHERRRPGYWVARLDD